MMLTQKLSTRSGKPIKLPQRSTEGSGYDFFAPYKMMFDRYDSRFQTFPTGISNAR